MLYSYVSSLCGCLFDYNNYRNRICIRKPQVFVSWLPLLVLTDKQIDECPY